MLGLMGSGPLIQMLPICFLCPGSTRKTLSCGFAQKEFTGDLASDTALVTFCAVINYQDQKQLRTEFIWAYSSRERVHNGREGMETDGRSRKLKDHTFNSKHKAEKNKVWGKTIIP